MSEQTTALANVHVISHIATPIPEVMDTGNSNRVIGRPWQQGESGNPDGRPVIKHITDALKEQMAKVDPSDTTGAQRLARKLFNHAEQDKDGYLSLAAIKEITDRTEGKAVQNTNVRGVIVMMPADAVLDASFNNDEPGDE